MRIKIQKTPNGKLLGSCVSLSAEIMKRYENLDYVELDQAIDDTGVITLRIR